MKLFPVFAAGTVLAGGFSSAWAETAFERDWKQLKDQRDKGLAVVREQINTRYKEALQLLLRRAMQNNDLEAALKFKKELEIISLRDSKWVNPADKAFLVFHADGSSTSSWGTTGSWAYQGDNKITLKFDKSELWTVDAAFQSVTRTSDGLVWKRGK